MAVLEITPPNVSFQWLDVESPNEEELLALGERFGIHRYSIKDCLEPDHLPKFEIQDGYQFVITRLWLESGQSDKIHTIQQATSKLAIFLGENFVMTIHRLPLEFIGEIKSRYVDKGRIKTTHDLAVKLIWFMLQTYSKPLPDLIKEIDMYEEQVFLKTITPQLMKRLYYLKRRVHIAHKLLQMTASVVHGLNAKDKIAHNDLKDLQVHLQSEYAQNLDDVNNLMHFYMSISAQKTNEVMRILTIFSAFFLPLTFIVGVYGMNFKYMPELDYIHGYKLTWLFMVLITILIFQWFWRKKWL